MPELPSGTVTFLFTDVEGSTRLLHELGPEGYAQALHEHRRLLREAFRRHGGVEVDTQGDAFFVAFPTAPGALAAAKEANEALASGPIRVRIGLHTGTPLLTEEGYVGADVHRAARIAALGHGGQVLVSSATAALVEPDGLRDLGEHRLKDLSAPERIYQLGEGDFPPLASLHRTNLPVPATPFLGRERELEELGELLAREDVRLLTLTGPGGTGKTRLALQAAGQAADRFPGGVFWVPLAPLRDPALVLETVAGALGASGELAEQIGDKRLLLLLDNFEHVVDAAADIADLLRRCPNLTVLVTSREPLRLEGEWEYAVDPLQEAEAVALFTARAAAVKRDFAPNGEVREICARLDNLPLAIELAAARVKVLSPRALLERLERRLPVLAGGARDLPERQRTLRATIAWSHELLPPDEQTLFRRLAVFRGGWTLSAAEQVCEADLDTLASLVGKSLVRVREGERFWMLETIREYAVERLLGSGEAEALRRRHAAFYFALAEEAEPQLWADSREALEHIESDRDNVRAALEELESSDQAAALNFAGALWRFWYVRGYMGERRRRLERLLAVNRAGTPGRAKVLIGAAVLSAVVDDAEAARARAEEALRLYSALGDAWGSAYSTLILGKAVAMAGEPAGARGLFETSAQLFRELGDEYYALIADMSATDMSHELGDFARARRSREGHLRRAREMGYERLEAGLLRELAADAIDDGRIAEAASILTDSIRIARAFGEPQETARSLALVARARALAGDAVEAAQIFAFSEMLHEQIGATNNWRAEEKAKTLAAIRAQLDDAAFAAASEQGTMMTLDDAVALAVGDAEADA